MIVGGWGERSLELLDLAANRTGGTLDRVGSLGVIAPAGVTEGQWRCWISGRLTNADALRERFRAPDIVNLNTLIARAHNQIGPSACEFLRGTFILVAVEHERGLASVSRDQLGGRPLLYARVGDGVLFAEHERELLDLLPSTPGPDRLALMRWIDRGTVLPGRTLYEGIRRVPPAHRLVLSSRGVAVERYWAPRYEGTRSGTRDELAEHLREEAFGAVDRAADQSRRPALLLSGGLDSACVAAGLAARRSPASPPVALASIFPTLPETDESDLIEVTAQFTSLPLERVPFDDRASILAPALRHMHSWGVPPATPNLFLMEPVIARARVLGVDVMLDGEGGDELFGLAPYLIADMLRAGRLGSAWSLTGQIPGMGLNPPTRSRLRALRLFGLRALLPDQVRRWRNHRRMQSGTPGESLLDGADAMAVAEAEDAQHQQPFDGPIWWRSLAEQLTDGGDMFDMSGQMRRVSREAGIDRRQPFVYDLDLVQAALETPPELLFEPLRDRPLLRDGLTGLIPEQVRTRFEKSYFTGLLPAGLATDGAQLLDRLRLTDAPIREYVCTETLDRLIEMPIAGLTPRFARMLWQVGLADTWLSGSGHLGRIATPEGELSSWI